ncbi:hypothetical protein AK51_25565 [Serratia nematodiphila DZ0503SBS1]|nr:hypothetical protein AK51_25565 [Serratia nematodiphila DZ0503SBS1]
MSPSNGIFSLIQLSQYAFGLLIKLQPCVRQMDLSGAPVQQRGTKPNFQISYAATDRRFSQGQAL